MAIEVINPATEEVDGRYEEMSKSELEQLITDMAAEQKKWALTSFAHRKALMLKAGAEFRNNKNKYGMIITQEMGKPITQAEAEIEKCASLCDYYANTAEDYLKPQPIETENTKSYRCFKPTGIIYAIMPWNFPFWQALRCIVPNLMAGNAPLLKHAPNSTGAALAMEKVFQQVGFPKNIFRSLVIDIDLSPYVVEHPEVKGVTLTGSERAGATVASQSGKALKKVVMELGGSDPYLILEDADVDYAVQQCAKSRLSNAGQICISAKRLIVVEKIYDEFVEKLKKQILDNFKCGDPTDPNTTMGPMAREDLMQELHGKVQKTIDAGAECAFGGKPIEGKGFFYPPTLLLNVKKGMCAYHEELFGPVVCVLKVKDEAEAIQVANDSPYGLGAAVFTSDLKKGERIARDEIVAGTCNVNKLVGSDQRLPFGGTKLSGFGRELASEGLHEFSNVKTVIVK
jgi:succinate-semialdehyde dehydrogenase/glutarate-semialdehyde dehydrogenase